MKYLNISLNNEIPKNTATIENEAIEKHIQTWKYVNILLGFERP